jgi:hypothetical protein
MPKTKIISLVCSLFLSVFSFQRTFAQTETINSGSYIIDLGFQSPIISNSVKPYGLVDDLLKNYYVSVKPFINAGKVKDGIDFSHNEKNLMVKAIVISA